MVPLVADYYSTMEAAWVVLSVASTNASATQTITIANAYAAAVGRWADQMAGTYPGIYAGYMSDMEFANAARRTTQELAHAAYQNAMSAAGAVWLETALPAWVTYKDELSDHMVAWVDTSSLAWDICGNAIADAALAYPTAASARVACETAIDAAEATWELTEAAAWAAYESAGVVAGQLVGIRCVPPASHLIWLQSTSELFAESGDTPQNGAVAFDSLPGTPQPSGTLQAASDPNVSSRPVTTTSTVQINGITLTKTTVWIEYYIDGYLWDESVAWEIIEVYYTYYTDGIGVQVSPDDPRRAIEDCDVVARLGRERTRSIANGAGHVVRAMGAVIVIGAVAIACFPGPEDLVVDGILATKLALKGIKVTADALTGAYKFFRKNASGVFEEVAESGLKETVEEVNEVFLREVVNAPRTMRGAPTKLGPVGSKAPHQVTPGIRELEGHYINDQGRSQPWRAQYDEFGRLIGRTDYNAGNRAAGIPDVHHHTYRWGAGEIPMEIGKHLPGEFTP